MPDIHHGKSQEIFCVRLRRYDIVVIRNKLRMHAGLLAHAYDALQLVIFRQSQSDDDLIQPVLGKDDRQILRPSKHLHAPVFRPPRLVVRQDPSHDISPSRVRLDPVYILLRRPAVPDQQNMLLVISLSSDVPKPFS